MAIRLLIVDDEALTRESLLEYVNWKACGITELSTACNGQTALESFDSFKPDILLCDVRMPKMNGIQLAQRIREKSKQCRIVFISGYTDKEYLITAIELEAVRYIEKPIAISELEALIRIITDDILKERAAEKKSSDMERRLNAGRAILQQDIINAWLDSNYDPRRFDTEYSQTYFPWQRQGSFSAISIATNRLEESSAVTRDIVRLLSELVYESVSKSGGDYIMGAQHDRRVAIVLQGACAISPLPNGLCVGLLNLLQKRYSKSYFSIGISRTLTGLSQIPSALKQAADAADCWFYDGYGHINADDDPRGEAFAYEKPEGAERIAEYTKLLAKRRPMPISDTQKSLWDCYERLSESSLEPLDDKRLSWETFRTVPLTRLSDIITRLALRAAERDSFFCGLSPKVYTASLYIIKNIASRELSLRSIAEAVDISPNYLCTLFRQETEQTINQYIQRLRIDKVCDLLRLTDTPLYIIAQKVGYSDANYLSNVFKRVFGISPIQYRTTFSRNEARRQHE